METPAAAGKPWGGGGGPAIDGAIASEVVGSGLGTGGEGLDVTLGKVGAGTGSTAAPVSASGAADMDDVGGVADESVSATETLTNALLDSGVELLDDDGAVAVCPVGEWPQPINTTQVTAVAAVRRLPTHPPRAPRCDETNYTSGSR